MKIVFDLTPIYDHLTGVERYNINITKEMIIHHPENDYILLFKNEVHKEFEAIVKQRNVGHVTIPACNKLLFIQLRLLKALRKIDADYYVFLSFTSPVLFKQGRIINAIHDLTCWDCPETIPAKMKHYYRYTYGAAARNSWRLITVSKFSQRRICEKYKLETEKVPVIYDGLTDIFSKEYAYNPELKKKYGLPNKYMLSLSTLEPRKNLQLLIKAFGDLAEKNKDLPDLVLAGRQGWKLEEIVGEVSDALKERIHFTGFVADEDLPQLYADAEVFVFPSKYEGFGLPVIEAMSQRTIVITSDAASLPEVAGEAGIIFRSDDIDDLKRAICKYFEMNEKEKKTRKQNGFSISQGFSWKNEAEKLYRIML